MKQVCEILIVEDSPTQTARLKYILEEQGYSVAVASNGREGIAAVRQQQPALIISDIMMPEMDGYEMSHAINQDLSLGKIPIMLLSTLSNPEDIVRGINSGADSYVIKPYDEAYLLSTVRTLLENAASQETLEEEKEHEIVIDGKLYALRSSHQQILTLLFSIYQSALEQNRQLEKAQAELQELNESLESLVRKKTEQLSSSFVGSTRAISELLESRDPYTAGHARGVTDLAVRIARRMGMTEEEIEGIKVCGILHDLGKVVISAGILSKPGKLSGNEFGIIRQHPETAFHALHRIPFPWPVAQIVRQHHERVDGSGYPKGLRGDEIHPWARILAVADVVDAMITHRPYRPALPKKVVLEELSRGRGSGYDPRVVDECKAVMHIDSSRILVVDDDSSLVEIIMEYLRHMDLECEGYQDPRLALEAFREKSFAVVITDIHMPHMNGLEFLKEIRKIQPASKVIMITGFDEKEHVVESMRRGASDFLEKPMEMANLRLSVERLLKSYQEES